MIVVALYDTTTGSVDKFALTLLRLRVLEFVIMISFSVLKFFFVALTHYIVKICICRE